MSSALSITRSRESLRVRYRPHLVKILFVGESPPASGRFFYQADSGLYRALRDCFLKVFPSLGADSFLAEFHQSGCYLVDLCGNPVDRLPAARRKTVCRAGEVRLATTLRKLGPQIAITLVKSIAPNIRRAAEQAGYSGPVVEVPYPGRWHHHRAEFMRILVPIVRARVSPVSAV